PGLKLLFAQGAAEVRKHQQLVGKAALAEAAAAQAPSRCPRHPAGKDFLNGPRRFTLEAIREAQLSGRAAQKLLTGVAKESLTSTIHQAQALTAVESKHRDVDLRHHF